MYSLENKSLSPEVLRSELLPASSLNKRVHFNENTKYVVGLDKSRSTAASNGIGGFAPASLYIYISILVYIRSYIRYIISDSARIHAYFCSGFSLNFLH